MTPAVQHTREQVLRATHPAWAGRELGGVPEFYFDGTEFWRSDGIRDRRIAKDDAPPEGWWHREGCRCRACEDVGQALAA